MMVLYIRVARDILRFLWPSNSFKIGAMPIEWKKDGDLSQNIAHTTLSQATGDRVRGGRVIPWSIFGSTSKNKLMSS